jgi:hypothetical protein
MTVKKEKVTEWSTKDKVVWGKPATLDGMKKIRPKFQYKTEPWERGEYYIAEYKGEKTYSVHFYISGYASLKNGYTPSKTEILLSGETLSNCKKFLARLIKGMYSGTAELQITNDDAGSNF